jgi:hypothetical protein
MSHEPMKFIIMLNHDAPIGISALVMSVVAVIQWSALAVSIRMPTFVLAIITPQQLLEYATGINTVLAMTLTTIYVFYEKKAKLHREEFAVHQADMTEHIARLVKQVSDLEVDLLEVKAERDHYRNRRCPFPEEGAARCYGSDSPIDTETKPWPPESEIDDH